MFLNVDKNANIVIESELSANVRCLALMNVSSRNWFPFCANECVFSRYKHEKVNTGIFLRGLRLCGESKT